MSHKKAKIYRKLIRRANQKVFEAREEAAAQTKKAVFEFRDFVNRMKFLKRLHLCWRILRKKV